MSLTDLLDQYLHILDERHDNWFSKHLAAPASTAHLDAVEKRFGAPLPTQLRELYEWRNGPTQSEIMFFVTHGVWTTVDTASSSELDFFAESYELQAHDSAVGGLIRGFPIAGGDATYVVVETDGPLTGAVFWMGRMETFQITHSLTDFMEGNLRALKQTPTEVFINDYGEWGLIPAGDEWNGGYHFRPPGHPESLWPVL